MKLLALSIAPGLALLLYIYIKDKYEREPLRQVIKAFLLGATSALIILIFWLIAGSLNLDYTIGSTHLSKAFSDAFIGAAVPEELVKFLTFILFFYKIKDFNEWFDGIVYAVAISLGFATLENILYVFQSGVDVGIKRAFFAVPSHFIDGVTQGFFFSLAKFGMPKHKTFYLTLALISAVIIHGIYDFIIFLNKEILLSVFIIYFAGIVYLAKKLISVHLEKSQFKGND